MKRKIGVGAMLFGAVLLCGITLAQNPVVNIDRKVHPQLGGAQALIADAAGRIDVAISDKKINMHGHAEKAKQLLYQASLELKAAAEAADASLHEKR
jgi:hypothetical protein